MPRVEPTLLAARVRRAAASDAAALADAELVGRYAGHRDAAAFEVLVWRHGPMVWATCRRILLHQHDVEDAFQATFLALARTAKSISTRQAVAGWLHRVATNAALNLKAKRGAAGLAGDVPARPERADGGLAGVVDEELDRLPSRMRAAFVLCGLEGKTSAEAARELGCPVGTVDSRLHAARTRLRDRLTRRGFGPGAMTGLVLSVVPPATSVATAVGTGAGVPPRPAAEEVAGQVVRIMTRGGAAMKTVTATTLVVALTGAAWAFGGFGDAQVPAPTATPPATPVGQPPVTPTARSVTPAAAQPRQPGGVLGDQLGVYLTIEGVRAGAGKVETGTLMVDVVNGKKLDKAVAVVVRGLDYPAMTIQSINLPAGQRCVLKGYESGEMIGTPSALLEAAREEGRTDVLLSQAVWRWRPYFVARIAVEPKGLELPR
jgi:RNA polymerase sigma factor (sigma-70 family)